MGPEEQFADVAEFGTECSSTILDLPGGACESEAEGGAAGLEDGAGLGARLGAVVAAEGAEDAEVKGRPCWEASFELPSEDTTLAGGLSAEAANRLHGERAALLRELCRLKAKFELTLETLRSILRLGVEAGWADIIEQCEALAQCAGADKVCSSPLPLAGADMDLEREQLEENLEAQAAYTTRLWELVQKQQHLLDMTAKLDWKSTSERADALLAERDSLREQLHSQQEEMSRQDTVLRQQAAQIADLEAALGEEQRLLAASAENRRHQEVEDRRTRAEGERLRADSERKQAEVRDLVDALRRQEDLVERLRAELQVHEAAERRRRSYHPSRSSSGFNEDAVSEFNSSVSSSRTSARVTPKMPVQRVEDMDKDERDAFLSHFPMSSRTERHLRSRLDDRRWRPGTGA